MARPRVLTDQERLESNRRRQARWRKRHEGFARLKVKNGHARRREEVKEVEVGWEERLPEKREVREVQETEAVSFDELEAGPGVLEEQAARMEKIRPLVGPVARKLPVKRVVGYEGPETEEHEKAVEWLERKAREVEVEM